jgi:LysM repeat protein
MGTTLDRMKQAMEKRKALEASMVEENNSMSAEQPVALEASIVEKNNALAAEQPVPLNKIVLRLFYMQLICTVILGGIIYVFINQSTKDSLNTIVAKLEQLENRFEPLKEQLSKVEETIKTANAANPSHGVFADASITAQAPPQSREMPEKAKQSASRRVSASSTEIRIQPSSHQKEITQRGQQYHVVESGDTLYRISKHYGISVEEICRLNNFKQGQTIQPGQKLLVTTMR